LISEETYVISDLEQIRALADPFRHRILGEFAKDPCTTKQVAVRLGQKPTKLYHHVALLEKVGLVKLIETRPNRGTTERYLQAVARRFALASSGLESESMSIVETMFSNAFAQASTNIRASVAAGTLKDNSGGILANGRLCLSKAKLKEFQERLSAMIAEYGDASEAGQSYEMLVAVFPTAE
jgi:DNA-binding transcriptional ArsR family regulator